jgi:hypothetical protein
MDVEAMEEGEINDEDGEEVVMEDMDYAELKNKLVKPKKRVAGETGSELSSEEELMAQFSTVRSRKKPKKSVTDDVKHSSDRDQNINKSRNHNQAKLSCMNYVSYFSYHRPILSTTNHQAPQLTDVTTN